MKNLILSLSLALAASLPATSATLDVASGRQTIHPEIYGQFAEHLGTCIYGGLWVGPESPIANKDGYRLDVLRALQDLHVPVLRWPGGCFADEYHWQDGIGPRDQRPTMQNNNWGGTIENNSFGTHEFLNLCELLGCEPYISGNVGSGTVEELAKWVEYMTSDGDTPMARLRRQNGRDRAWHVKYLGVGNESWGCGGNMHPEYYADLFRRYATYCRNYDSNRLYRIASGASDYDYNWTRVLMHNVGSRMHGLSLHYYTVVGWGGSKGSATHFADDDYYWALAKSLGLEGVIAKHDSIMTATDPEKKIGLLVDEWGTWWDEEPGTIRGHLYQQNALRDAFVAALSLNIFHRHCDRVRMANIAQIVNVLQSMILTDQEGPGHMVLTPTYHVFRMYAPFQGATYLPLDIQSPVITTRGDSHAKAGRTLPLVSSTAAKTKDGAVVIALTNVSLTDKQDIDIDITGAKPATVAAQILTAPRADDYNDFQHPDRVAPAPFKGAKLKAGKLTLTLPAKSLVVLTLK